MPKLLNADVQTGNVVHEWGVREYENYSRGPWWYIIMITLGLFFVVYGMMTSNFLLSLIIILAGIIIFLHSHQAPIEVPFQITELGVVVGSRFYPYSEITSFYIIYNPPEVKTLFLETKSALRPMLKIPLEDQNPLAIRETLRKNVDENLTVEEEPLSDTLARQWKIQ